MSHKHYCNHAGHFWQCDGNALRYIVDGAEPSECICETCELPMELGNHARCQIEFLDCPEHLHEWLRAFGHEPDNSPMPQPMEYAQSNVFTNGEGNFVIGFCLWCHQDFHSFKEAEEHNFDGSRECPLFPEVSREQSVPPVLQIMLEGSRLLYCVLDYEDSGYPS